MAAGSSSTAHCHTGLSGGQCDAGSSGDPRRQLALPGGIFYQESGSQPWEHGPHEQLFLQQIPNKVAFTGSGSQDSGIPFFGGVRGKDYPMQYVLVMNSCCRLHQKSYIKQYLCIYLYNYVCMQVSYMSFSSSTTMTLINPLKNKDSHSPFLENITHVPPSISLPIALFLLKTTS